MNCHRALLSLSLFSIVVSPATAPAQTYPAKLVRIIVAAPAGTTNDNIIRLFTPKLTETYGQPFIVENRAGGAAGNVGASFVARSPADGYTLLSAAASIPASISLYKNLDFDFLRDFDPIALLASAPFMMAVNPSLGVGNVQEFIKLAKTRPGQLNYGSSGIGGTNHLAAELFNGMAGIKMVHVPYKAVGIALPDLVQGSLAMMFLAINQVQALAKAGRVRVLAISSATRTPHAPELPTVAESGLPGYESATWFALLAPARTPQDIVTRLNNSIIKLSQTQEIRERIAGQSADPMGGTPQQAAVFIKNEVIKWAKVVADSGARAE